MWMLRPEILPGFVLAVALLAMVPGPATALVIRQTIRDGRRTALLTTAGNEVGLLGWAIASAVGLAALVAASQVAYDAIRVAGAVVLIGLGVQSLLEHRRGGPGPVPDEVDAGPPRPLGRGRRLAAFRIGLLSNLANPKAAVFAFSFYPQFIPRGAPVLATTLLLAGIQLVVDTTWYVLVAWLVNRARAVMRSAAVRRRLERLTGLVLIGLGARLATDHR
jgi:threonine/homoserine/homoserine lactone efflux protein